MKKMTETAMRSTDGGAYIVRYIINNRWTTYKTYNNHNSAKATVVFLCGEGYYCGIYNTNNGNYDFYNF